MVLKLVILHIMLGKLRCAMIILCGKCCVENTNNHGLLIYKKGVAENNLLKFK